MPSLFDVREVEGHWETLVSYGTEGEEWGPLATLVVTNQMLTSIGGNEAISDLTLADALRAEGWLAPEDAAALRTALARAEGRE